ncbi:hypothetical protein B566_EDAN000918 [Ephemera danica]|nr:hypothetical protein B566_EDAN000918 [Ephemera danica]
MASAMYKFILIVGFLFLFHSAYSAAQHRTYLRLTEQEFDALPIDILTQGIISMFVAMYGVLHIAGEFKEIRATVELEDKSWETLRNNPSFYVFNHRGKALSPDYMPPSRKSALEERENEL